MKMQDGAGRGDQGRAEALKHGCCGQEADERPGGLEQRARPTWQESRAEEGQGARLSQVF